MEPEACNSAVGWHLEQTNNNFFNKGKILIIIFGRDCTIVFKKNGPTRGGYKRKFQREVHKSKFNAFESSAMLRCLFRLIL